MLAIGASAPAVRRCNRAADKPVPISQHTTNHNMPFAFNKQSFPASLLPIVCLGPSQPLPYYESYKRPHRLAPTLPKRTSIACTGLRLMQNWASGMFMSQPTPGIPQAPRRSSREDCQSGAVATLQLTDQEMTSSVLVWQRLILVLNLFLLTISFRGAY